MPPPPSLLDPGPERTAQSFDGALGDSELVVARNALTQGRWQATRSLLLRTGDDWDRRGHRVTVLAREPYAAAWARDWLQAESGSADAAVLLALSLVRRVLRGREEPAAARTACAAAAALEPADPTPWLGLLLLERAGPEADRIFAEVLRRHPDHHHAHHLMVARLAERDLERGPDPRHEVYDFARRAADRAPADSPLAVLPVVAHTERHRALAVAGRTPDDPAASPYWSGRRARRVLRTAFHWWLEWERDDHPRHHVDLNFLAHAMSCAGRAGEAAALFRRIGRHATPAPWAYPDQDPCAAFRAARARAFGTAPDTASRYL
ncbi:hypothetical protein [Streptomyces sp. NPDC058964]|uniref:hypothetical protein n=1 Tax=Streptomyces sp. NPDC058964 TaxID=3346681 RepID=UPI00369962B3